MYVVQPLEQEKGAARPDSFPESVLPPVFVTTNVRVAEEPTVMLPKARELGVTVIVGGTATATPVPETGLFRFEVLLQLVVHENLAVSPDDTFAVGEYRTVTVRV